MKEGREGQKDEIKEYRAKHFPPTAERQTGKNKKSQPNRVETY